jgi:hypothetical protein
MSSELRVESSELRANPKTIGNFRFEIGDLKFKSLGKSNG